MTEKHKHQLAQLFEKPLIEEFDNALFQELPSGAVFRHDTQTRVRYTPLVLEGLIRVTRTDDNGRELFIYNIDPSESCFLTISASFNQDFRGTDALNAVTEGKKIFFSVSFFETISSYICCTNKNNSDFYKYLRFSKNTISFDPIYNDMFSN
jgi:hypothetical protein